MNNIDQLTLELLVNKGQYKKYLAVADPQRFEEQQKHLEKIAKYENKIRSMFSNLMEGKQIKNDVNESFDQFIKDCIRHCENKELEKEDFPKDEDVMFGNMDSSEEEEEDDEELATPTPAPAPHVEAKKMSMLTILLIIATLSAGIIALLLMADK